MSIDGMWLQVLMILDKKEILKNNFMERWSKDSLLSSMASKSSADNATKHGNSGQDKEEHVAEENTGISQLRGGDRR